MGYNHNIQSSSSFLYQNNDIFNADSEINTTFLPNVDFKLLFNCEGVSENTFVKSLPNINVFNTIIHDFKEVRNNQKYFLALDAENKIAPYFFFITNQLDAKFHQKGRDLFIIARKPC